MNFKEKVERFKAIMADVGKLEKVVQDKLMEVADHLAPKVQGGEIAPKQVVIPEPEEYPDIEMKPVPVYKHSFDQIADQIQKNGWQPERIAKTQKNPSTKVPYEEKASHREYMKNPENVSAHMQSLRDVKKDDSIATSINQAVQAAQKARGSIAPPPPPPEVASSIANAFGKTDAHPIEAYATGFSKSSWKPEKLGKATIEGEIPAKTPYHPPAQNPALPESKKKS